MKKYFNCTYKFKLIYIILVAILLISILCKIVLLCLSSNEVYIYLNRIVNNEIQQYLLYIGIIDLTTFLILILKSKIQKSIITIVCMISLVGISVLNGGLWEPDKSYFEFRSPDNKTIIIEESSWLQGGWSKVYQKINSNIICGLNGNISTDDGYRPFSNNDYAIEWSINSVKITYGFGSEDIQKSEIINLK